MRVGFVLLVMGAIAIVIVQNSTPALPLVVFGSSTVALPVGLWLLLGIGAGLITSVLMQGLLAQRSMRPQVAPRYREPQERELPRQRPRRPKTDWDEVRDPDWDAPDPAEGWDIETPPEEPTMPRSRPVQDQTRRPRQAPPEAGVKDANYRVIIPPSGSERSDPGEEEGENWDF